MTVSKDFDKVITRLIDSAVGYDPLLRIFGENGLGTNQQGFPPYNILKINDEDYRIEIAIAGFSEKDIEITEHDGMLTVEGKQPETNDEHPYIYKGIASRSFKRQFRMAEYIEVVGAIIINGVLTIDLHRNMPEERKPKKIAISSSAL